MLHLLIALNDGGLTMGGSPTLLKGHPTVSMASEVIRMTVSNTAVLTDCTFVFVNKGPACDVRMGFPDQGFGAEGPYEGTGPEEWDTVEIRSVFTWFKSWVNGKMVSCETVKGKNVGELYRAKTVHFPANGKVVVRDRYSMRPGGGIVADGDAYSKETGYILHTGSSWRGNIGRSTIIVEFDAGSIKTPVSFQYSSNRRKDPGYFNKFRKPKQGIICYGPSKPSLKGRTLTFVRKNWRPTENDDISVQWGYRKFLGGDDD